MMSFGKYLVHLRKERGWSQYDLARYTGIPRATIASIETDRAIPKTDIILKLASKLNIGIEILYKAAGYEVQSDTRHIETPDELLDKLRLASPVAVPVYTSFPFHAGEPTEPTEYVYRTRPNMPAGENIEGYVVHGNCLEPTIKNGDIIIVDRDAQIDIGDIVACQAYDKLFIGRLEKRGDELWIVNGDGDLKYDNCHAGAVVIEVIKRLK